ncbi:MAG TPA: serine hydrolase [Candidatus Baltobacteraceae bacterium]|nr:serine hydrolase [Candidatus Baltobacteraceae bacterium]
MAARFAAVFAILALCASFSARADAQIDMPTPIAQLQAALANVPNYAPGHVALEIKDLATGYTSGVNANAVMPAASTIKIPIMVEVFKQMENGKFDLNRRVHLEAGDRDWGSGDIADAPAGSGFTVSYLLAKMITVSDNTAANMLIRLVGRTNINATMKDLGLHHTHLADYIRTAEWGVRRTLRTTPSDMVRLLSDMAKQQLIDQWASNKMISILEGQQINTLLPVPLPPDVLIAHKTGSFNDTLNDVGIVYGPEPYVIAVMTTDLPSLDSGRSFIRHISKMAFNRMEQLAQWRLANGSASPLSADATNASQAAPPAPAANSASADGAADDESGDVPMWGASTAASPAPAPTATPKR